MDGTNWVAMGLIMVMFVVVVAVVVWAVMQWSRHTAASTPAPGSTTTGARSAREVLDDRLARGEIDVDEYQQRRAALERPDS